MVVEVKIIVKESKVFGRCTFLKDCSMEVVGGGDRLAFLSGPQHLPFCWMELHVPCIIPYSTKRMQYLITVILASLTQWYCVFLFY